ncbi:MAG TPA: hypothetical protein VN726_00700, partial [Hanamia sp.]|nr:hypothetical protein [Hanamia sp.]
MKKLILSIFLSGITIMVAAQSNKTSMYDFIKMLLYDSTGFENVGDWQIGENKKFPVTWKDDRVIMSEDTSINFYRRGIANVVLDNGSRKPPVQPVKWNIMLK